MSPPHLPLAAAAATSAAVGVALSIRLLLLLSRSRALKPLAATTSAAAAALRTPRLLAAASSPLAALLAASKAASKSYKAARALDPAARLPRLPSSKRVKAAFAAASLLRLAAAAPLLAAAPSPTAFAALAVLKSGYKLSKNSAKVVEGFLGLQVHKGFRNGVDALGVVVKVAVIASELAVWVGARFWTGDGRGPCVRFLGLARPPGSLVLVCSTSSSTHQHQVVLFDPGTIDIHEEDCWFDDDYPQEEPSGLLCLAVPLPDMAKLVAATSWVFRFSKP
ncbi:uncharacterized protein [Lolium perenne]|uniref:uncharacterized protein n=1 Tax=Lolium perenne TaxID=4522 RepID=UPI0021F55D1B|nr:uncharacterized protein LOC127326912 [Lolium perenne]XP_051209657.1 uncharacterized protein LOC127326912 [Lolium perenne]XP_051209658.1 uncharacterized protein LOC127326912 [Lolium perenne]